MVGTPNRFRVLYRDEGKLCAFLVHTLEDAQFWASHLLRRWQLDSWIEGEQAPATRTNR